MMRLGRGFTTIELLVSMVILIITIVAVTEVFNISTETATRTTAHADIVAASAAIQQRLASLISKIQPGMLIIDCPTPTGPRADLPGGPSNFRFRHDRLVFIASGPEFQSFTDPRRGSPDYPRIEPAAGTEALIYFGPGIPLTSTDSPQPRPFDDDTIDLAGSEWALAQRSILFLLDPPNLPDPAWRNRLVYMDAFTGSGGMLHGGALVPVYKQNQMDVVTSSATQRATAATFIEYFNSQAVDLANLLSAAPDAKALWEPNYCPTMVTLFDPQSALNYYTHSGTNFQLRVADFRIDWTDGRRIDPSVSNGDDTRWFGLRLDLGSVGGPGGLQYIPTLRGKNQADTTMAEAEVFGLSGGMNQVEWSSVANGQSSFTAAYRAVWRTATWACRPKALRFSYRIYDSGNRLRNQKNLYPEQDGWPNTNNSVTYERYGESFTVVIPVP